MCVCVYVLCVYIHAYVCVFIHPYICMCEGEGQWAEFAMASLTIQTRLQTL